MFDDGAKITLFAIGLAALFAALVGEKHAPPPEIATAVNTARLPSLPLTAAPDGAPAQTRVTATQVDLGHGFEARLLHGYVIEGRVVTRREFRFDATSPISPLDLGIVWGGLARPGGTDDLEFSTAPRAVWSTPAPDADLPADWPEQVTNNHLIPANQSVNAALMAVEIGARIRIRGYLVEVTGDRISIWRSSTARDDSTLVGGCEIILVTDVEVLAPNDPAT